MSDLFTRLSMQKIINFAQLLSTEAGSSAYASLEKIFTLTEEIKAVDTTHVEPTAHAFDIEQPLRSDVITEVNRRESLQASAPQIKAGLYLVPAVIES